MRSTWVDFRVLKQVVSIEMAIAYYGLTLRRVHGPYLRGRCPLPTHVSKSSVQSFIVNTEKNVWVFHSNSCVASHGWHRGGNVLDFVAAMERCSIRDAALKLQEWFSVTPSNEVRLWLSVIAYNLGNLWWRLALPKRSDKWSLTSLQQRLVKTGGRLVKHARYYWLLLAASPDAPPLRVDGTADRVVARASGIGRPPTEPTSVTRGPGDGKVSETPAKRGTVPSPSSLRGAKTGPLCSRWRHRATLTRPTVAFSGGQMYAAERYRSRKWKFPVKCQSTCVGRSFGSPHGRIGAH